MVDMTVECEAWAEVLIVVWDVGTVVEEAFLVVDFEE